VSTLDQFKQSTLRQTIWKTIREAILRGELAPGSPINQASLAARFGVSRGPLREALSSLEKEGLVTNIPYRGTFVADFDDRIITETYSVRRVLEAFAAELAIQNGTAQQMAELRDIFSEMAEVAAEQDMEKFHELDLQLHRHIYLMADHELLLQMWNAIETNVKRGIFFGQFRLYTPSELLDAHLRIVEAFEVRDVEAAKREIDTHITDGCARLIAQWSATQR
jgi:DNA-binding GntR family transcriptional regulator